jgi:hypothetical protein
MAVAAAFIGSDEGRLFRLRDPAAAAILDAAAICGGLVLISAAARQMLA